jgi:hypothetical protein
MSDCVRLSDRMPDVAQGRIEWTPTEVSHLSGCPDCRREWHLVRAASRLGQGLFPRLDSEKMSRSLLQRLESGRVARARRRLWSLAGLAAAAGLAAVLWGGNPEPVTQPLPEVGAVGLEIPLPELEELQAAELDSVLRHIDDPPAAGPAPENGELSDLNSEELETVLDFWEG